jgi:hypothetical protein
MIVASIIEFMSIRRFRRHLYLPVSKRYPDSSRPSVSAHRPFVSDAGLPDIEHSRRSAYTADRLTTCVVILT